MVTNPASTPNLTAENIQPVTAVISHLVKTGREESYEEWLKGIIEAAQKFEGHMGVSVLRPADRSYPEYVSILKFDCYSHLKRWMESDIRKSWLEWAKPLIQKSESVQTLSGLETWFTLPGRILKTPPARYKMAILTSLAVYVLSLFWTYMIGGWLSPLPLFVRAIFTSTFVVFPLTYGVMAFVTKIFYKWLYPHSAQKQ